MTPVDRHSVRAGVVPRAAASAAAMWAWSASPGAPVAAFADPDVPITASAQPYPASPSGDVSERCAIVSRTGAAANAFCVKTPAAAAGPPVVATTIMSGRPLALIPIVAARARKPAGSVAPASATGRLDGSTASRRSRSASRAPSATPVGVAWESGPAVASDMGAPRAPAAAARGPRSRAGHGRC